MSSYVRALTIAGSDSGGGAGIQADLKTFSALGCFGMSAITAITAQNTKAVTSVQALPPTLVEAQIDAVFDDIGAEAVKVGMLFDAPIIEAVARALRSWNARNVVLDPVMVAKSGALLLQENAVGALREHLLPLADVATPNIPEAEHLLERRIDSREAMERAAVDLTRLGPRAVLLKGGHLATEAESPDVLAMRTDDGPRLRWFAERRVATKNTHGTGCTLSSAVAAFLARGYPLEEAVAAGKGYLHQAIVAGAKFELGRGHGPVHHFHAFWPHVQPREGRS
jgi:hydroxymethylpyrimidine/phosphomethylpyrimidine kinase